MRKQGNAAEGFHSLGQESLGNLRAYRHFLQVLFSKDAGLSCGDDVGAGRLGLRICSPFLSKALVPCEVQHLNAPLASLRIVEQQAGAIVVDDSSQAGADGGEHISEVKMGDHCIVDLEEQTLVVSLARQLLL